MAHCGVGRCCTPIVTPASLEYSLALSVFQKKASILTAPQRARRRIPRPPSASCCCQCKTLVIATCERFQGSSSTSHSGFPIGKSAGATLQILEDSWPSEDWAEANLKIDIKMAGRTARARPQRKTPRSSSEPVLAHRP